MNCAADCPLIQMSCLARRHFRPLAIAAAWGIVPPVVLQTTLAAMIAGLPERAGPLLVFMGLMSLLTIFGTISDATVTTADTLTKVGGGDVILAGTNTYAGVTDIQQGNVVIEPQVPDYWPRTPRLGDADILVLSRFAYMRRQHNNTL